MSVKDAPHFSDHLCLWFICTVLVMVFMLPLIYEGSNMIRYFYSSCKAQIADRYAKKRKLDRNRDPRLRMVRVVTKNEHFYYR